MSQYMAPSGTGSVGRAIDDNEQPYQTQTVGWEPGCNCRHDTTFGAPFPPIPCRVLDPFGGAGTTGLAAIALQRHCTLIELAEDYCDQIVKRLRDGLYPKTQKRDDLPGQLQLFKELSR